MANDNDSKYLLNELVTFIQHHLPGLHAGDYQLKVSQSVFDSKGNQINSDTLQNQYVFAVKGDRFALSAPADTVAAVFPEDGATGEYSAVLPHVLFYKKTLPWVRYPTLTPPDSKPVNGVDPDVPTWLTVLLLDEDDAAEFPALDLDPATRTMGDLFPTAAYSGSSLGSNLSYFQGATDTSDLDYGEQPTDPIQTIDLPLQLFWQLAPTVDDLKFMAHARSVSLENKPSNPRAAPPGEPVGDFSIVFGNRLPDAQKKAHAYLVSLESLAPYLPTNDGAAPSGMQPNDPRMIRLAVLKHWSFFATSDSSAFTDQVTALNGGPGASNTNLRLEAGANSGVVVKNALQMGYVPMNHQLRTGEQTVSWYRGPLVPYPISETRITIPITSADAAVIFDPTTGMFDESYAAAWNIGRMVALQDTAFSTALYNWKKTVLRKTVEAVENELINEQFGSILQIPLAFPEKELSPAKSLQHKLLQQLLQSK